MGGNTALDREEPEAHVAGEVAGVVDVDSIHGERTLSERQATEGERHQGEPQEGFA